MDALYGIIGYPLSHTFSPGFFNEKFRKEGIRAMYEAFPISTIDQFPALLKEHKQLKGLNVTIPYKQQVMQYLDRIDEAALAVGAVNCITIGADYTTTGHNTDIIGFGQSLKPLLQPWHDKALVLGTGGASKAVVYVLKQLGIAYKYVSRNPVTRGYTYNELNPAILAGHKLIINTTPLGMYPDITGCPLPSFEGIDSRHLVYDLIYNPPETALMRGAREKGAMVKNGLDMLHLQALAAWDIWNREQQQ